MYSSASPSLLHHVGGLSLRINGDLYSVHANLFIVSCSRRPDRRPPVFRLSNMITAHQCYHDRVEKKNNQWSKTCSYRWFLSLLCPNPKQQNYIIEYSQCEAMEFSLNGVELSLNSVNSANSENVRNHWSMNWVQYTDLLCYHCLCGLVVPSLSLTQAILGSNPTMLIFYFF